MNEIVTVGSVNIDLMAFASRRPRAGETLPGTGFRMSPGGKGLNQAVQVARSGMSSYLVARIGDDMFGSIILDYLKHSLVGMEFVVKDSAGTGIGHVLVEPNEQYSSVIFAGANSDLSPSDVDKAASHFVEGSGLLLQLEVPIETNVHAASIAKKRGGVVILNAAPAKQLPTDLLRNVDILIVNEIEAEMLCGFEVRNIQSDGLRALMALGKMCRGVVISLGERGCILTDSKGDRWHIPGQHVAVRKTLGAGDVFVGDLAVRVTSDCDLLEAARFANSAAASWVSAGSEVIPSSAAVGHGTSSLNHGSIPKRLE